MKSTQTKGPPSAEVLKNMLRYEPCTGNFVWLKSRGGRKALAEAGSIDSRGYRQIKIRKTMHLAHRLAFIFMGEPLPAYVDHINGNSLDNRWENLRPCTLSENQCNSKISKRNTSGVKNVSWDHTCKKWRARFTASKAKVSLGAYAELELAELIADEAREKFHGQFARKV